MVKSFNVLSKGKQTNLLQLLCYVFVFVMSNVALDTTNMLCAQTIFTEADFFVQVRANHPMAKQGQLFNATANAEVMAAKGGFDPKVFGDFMQKRFDDKTYFQYGEYGIKIPTWYGIEAKAGYNTASGTFLSDENKLPKQGQAIIGFSAPLLQGLLIDDRRADLFKARQSIGLNQAEREVLMNDLLFASAQIYWKWTFAKKQVEIYQNALDVAEKRFRAIRRAYELGDRMAMDTLESITQVQDRQLQYNDAILDLKEAELKLQNFLWDNDNRPQKLNSEAQPEILETVKANIPPNEREVQLINLPTQHPAMRVYQQKMEQLGVDLRLKREKLKPKLNIDYHFLGDGLAYSNLFSDNYKLGIRFSTSTLFRTERAGVQLSKIKIESTTLLRDQKALELQNKLQQAYADIDNINLQLATMRSQTENYRQLLMLENTRFELGESTFFLINNREMKYLDSLVKLAKLQSELRVATAQVAWANGTLR